MEKMRQSPITMNTQPETERKPAEPDDAKVHIHRDHVIEIIATAILALATIATAWSGYQAARWSGLQATLYSQAVALRVESARVSSAAERFRQIDIVLFTNWINASASGNMELAEKFERRFRPEFKAAFEAWMATDPDNNPDAPSGPFVMPEYYLSLSEQALELEEQAASTFDQGKTANQTSDQYIFNTVILASVLFLAGITSRFNWLTTRVVITIIALAILLYGLYNIATYPIL